MEQQRAPQTPYEILGGEEGVRALAGAFYEAMDALEGARDIRAMHQENLEEIKEKLFEFLSGWMGGPPIYARKYGGVCLNEPHAPFAIGEEARDQWLKCMDKALEDIGASDALKDMLRAPLFQIADVVRNQP